MTPTWLRPLAALVPAAAALAALALSSASCGARSELASCEIPGETRPCATACGPGVETCAQGRWQGCTAPRPEDAIPITGTVRDFLQSHPDFEGPIADDRGMVEPALGEDGRPVYAGNPTTPTTNGKERFDEWFRDVEGINLSAPHTITLERAPENALLYRFNDQAFFPIDGALLGDEGNPHNYHFTFELAVNFRYVGGEIFAFSGDDDLWVFINGRLAIDLGGVHGVQSQAVVLDERAEQLRIEVGEVYPLALFFAERHTSSSTFRIDTTIADFEVCPEP